MGMLCPRRQQLGKRRRPGRRRGDVGVEGRILGDQRVRRVHPIPTRSTDRGHQGRRHQRRRRNRGIWEGFQRTKSWALLGPRSAGAVASAALEPKRVRQGLGNQQRWSRLRLLRRPSRGVSTGPAVIGAETVLRRQDASGLPLLGSGCQHRAHRAVNARKTSSISLPVRLSLPPQAR